MNEISETIDLKYEVLYIVVKWTKCLNTDVSELTLIQFIQKVILKRANYANLGHNSVAAHVAYGLLV